MNDIDVICQSHKLFCHRIIHKGKIDHYKKWEYKKQQYSQNARCQEPVLPMASMPAGGFIVLGVVCAVWRALARKHKEYLKTEARGTLAAHPRKEVQDQ